MATAIKHGTIPFTSTKVLQKDVLNYASLGENSNKYFIMELQEGTGQYPFRIYAENGRMGGTPQKRDRFYNSLYEAESEYRKLKSEKNGKGYVEIKVDDTSASAPTTVTVKQKTKKQDLSQINDKVLRLIGKLYQDATSYLVQAIQTPLGKLSASQVAKGLEILARIEDLLDNGISNHQLDRLTNEFYSVIPVTFGARVDYQKFLINNYNKLNQQKDLLGVMSSVVQVQDSLEKTLEDKYKALNIKLKALSERTKEYKSIKEMVVGTHSRHHHFGVNVQEIYKIEDMVGHDKFNPLKVETMDLFHGSRNENVLSIMQNGLMIKPKSAVHTGSMFGSGIYFASDVTKSANYCWGFNGGSRNDSYYMFISEVATGKIKGYENAQPHLSSAPYGYNSVRGVKGRSLLHDEYIVFNESQSKLKYIIEFKKN
jgi:poly [ADP-ribose] polymerase